MQLKQVILVRSDLRLPKGKLAVQVAHASLQAALLSHKRRLNSWLAQGAKKVVLKVSDLKELVEFKKRAEQKGFIVALITDAGHTTVKPGTTTCLAIGPEKANEVDKLTGELKMV